MFDRAYVVSERIPGSTLNELTYRRPEVIEDNVVSISYQLGLHMAFSFIFGSKDGFQTNYIFDPVEKILTRIDKESFLDVPSDPSGVLAEDDVYSREIAACELTNLKYIPSFRSGEGRSRVLYAFKQGFLDKYSEIKSMKGELLQMVDESRSSWFEYTNVEELQDYHDRTVTILKSVGILMDLDPEKVFDRLLRAKVEVDGGKKN
jgi:hypothetical protein